MVLRRNSVFQFPLMLLLVIGLNACSMLGPKSDSNRSPNKTIIPASSTTSPSPSLTPEQATSEQENKPQSEANTPSVVPVPKRHKPGEVLTSILDSAKKAIQLEQWLRAQHHIEHALRVAPKDAEVFYLYGLVYEGLGVDNQAINMLKRAKFLARPKSDIYQLAESKLATLAD